MKLINSETVIFFDCDDTMVIWDPDKFNVPHDGSILIVDPYDKMECYLKPHEAHIKLLKQHAGRKYTVIVWSAAGCLWAQEVVKALGIEKYVDYCMSKPVKYVDDLPSTEWMGTHLYMKPKERS